MRNRERLLHVFVVFTIVMGVAFMSTAGVRPVSAVCSTPIFINEFHYDNVSADTGEFVEVFGPANTVLTGWSIVLYNGSASQLKMYDTISLSGTISDAGDGFGTLSFARAGIQNGAPDGFALVSPGDVVVQFLSYEGTFTPIDGPAAGMLSVDVGVSESGTTPVGYSLQLVDAVAGTGGGCYEDYSWNTESAESPGAINSGQTVANPSAVTLTSFGSSSMLVPSLVLLAGLVFMPRLRKRR